MTLGKWRKQHKWFGIAVCAFLVMFTVSGIILNHRGLFADIEISRKYLPSRYTYRDWNGGLVRGSIQAGQDSLLLYGANGIWLYDQKSRQTKDFNAGLPAPADYRNIRRIASRHDGRLIAAATTGVYILEDGKWKELLTLPEKITDVETHGDSTVVMGRSSLFVDSGDGVFREMQLRPSPDADGKVTLFKTVWNLHNGELFGTAGKIIVDLIGLLFVFLCITGIIIWLAKPGKLKAKNIVWHNATGKYTIILTLLIAVTGFCLRPPLMIPLALTKTPAIPGTSLDTDNVWHDRLRAIRFDEAGGDWLISTSEGFFSLPELTSIPTRLTGTPPVSVMGINVWEKDADGEWLCGSFSGMFRWNRENGTATDYFTGEAASDKPGPPIGKRAIAGFCTDAEGNVSIVDYYDGTDTVRQPDGFADLPMSLWNVALEVHSGRFYIGSVATYVFIFIFGAAIIWCLISGYKIRVRRNLR